MRIVIALFLSLSITSCMVSEAQKAKLQELRQLAAETPKFGSFQQVEYSEITKPEVTVIAYFYRSPATYEEVKNFYKSELLAKGWNLNQDEPLTKWGQNDGSRRLSFKQGKYAIHLEYDSAKSDWNFAVDYGWYRDISE